jgi:glucose-6-phosphate dehydrogenase assembly protein OpcA
VVPLLVPDVPATLVVLSEGGERLFELLEPVLNRVVFDSRELPAAALRRPLKVLEEGSRQGQPCGVDDLAWRETISWRRTLRDIFDDPQARPLLASLREIKVTHSGTPTRALLLAGWLASRLERPELPIRLELADGPGTLHAIHLEAGDPPGQEYLTVKLSDDANRLRVAYATQRACVIPRSVPFFKQDEAQLLGGALERTTDQGVLHGSLEIACRHRNAGA